MGGSSLRVFCIPEAAGLRPGGPVHLPADSAEDLDLVVGDAGAAEKTTQFAEYPLWRVGIEVADGEKALAKMGHEPFDLLLGCRLRRSRPATGFSHADADGLRKIMSKKDRENELRDYHDRFIAGALEKGVDRRRIDAVWNMIMSFSGYSFCKPHSASYKNLLDSIHLNQLENCNAYCVALSNQINLSTINVKNMHEGVADNRVGEKGTYYGQLSDRL